MVVPNEGIFKNKTGCNDGNARWSCFSIILHRSNDTNTYGYSRSENWISKFSDSSSALFVWRKKAFGIAIIRLLLVAFTFGNVAAFLYSLGGMLLSFFTMAILRKTGKFSIVSVSCMGGVMHNMGQLVMAFFILQTQVLWTYLPVLILTGVISGVVIGILGGILMERLKGIWRIS